MKVLFLIDDFHIGGVTTFVQQYQRVLTDNGHQVTIVGRRANLVNIERFFPKARVVFIPGRASSGIRGRFLNFWEYWLVVWRVSAQEKFDLIHFSTTWSTVYALLVPYIWLTRRVITFYGAYHLELLSEKMYETVGLRTRVKTWCRRLIQNLTLYQAHQIITFSTFAKQQLMEVFWWLSPERITVIPGSVSPAPLLKKKPQSSLTIINFGRDEPRKGLVLLLKALSLLRKKIPFTAFIASPVLYLKRYNSSLEEYERQRLFLDVHFLHGLNGEEKKELLQLADVFVMPSVSLETFGLTVIEALSYGVPVIGTPEGAIPEILKQIDSRLVCASTTPEALKNKLKWFHGLSGAERNALRKKCYAKVRALYDREMVAKKITTFYQKVWSN